MAVLNASEPLGLPPGSIRALIALGFSGVTMYLFATNQPIDPGYLAITTLIVGNYFGTRGAENVEGHTTIEVLAPPATGDSVEDPA